MVRIATVVVRVVLPLRMSPYEHSAVLRPAGGFGVVQCCTSLVRVWELRGMGTVLYCSLVLALRRARTGCASFCSLAAE